MREETIELLKDHEKRLGKFESDESELKSEESMARVFSYNARYKLKANDPEKQRFCENVMLSKKYENILKDLAHIIIPDI